MSNLVPYEGRVVEPDESEALRRKLARLEEQLEDARREAHEAKEQSRNSVRAIQNLQRQLAPMYSALRAIFGEIDAVGIEEVGQPAASKSRSNAVWEKWINQLGGNRAAVLKALLGHGEMSRVQLRVASQVPDGSLNGVTSELGKMGLINRGGGKYSLKEL